jgi:hypothetical protein
MTLLRNLTGTTPVSDDAANVEDVFSTYLWSGNNASSPITINNGIKLSPPLTGTSTEFDGTNDYLSRSTDLTGNADGKTFTFSAWIYYDGTSSKVYSTSDNNSGVKVQISSRLEVVAYNSADSTILNARTADYSLPHNTWFHILVSFDLTNTSNRYMYLNDINMNAGATFSIYNNDNIDFTDNTQELGAYTYNGNHYNFLDGRLAHVFLDYTYRDLSTASNRRLFIDANGGSTPPATLSALNPIMYLPMTTAYSIGENLGTGGDFTSNGSPTIVDSGTEYVADPDVGGMVWVKTRISNEKHSITDTERGAHRRLSSDETSSENYSTGANDSVGQFNSDGFEYKDGWGALQDYVSWTFRKAERFFDVVTYTGDGTAGREIAHNLGCEVGMVIVKRLDVDKSWQVYHRTTTGTKALWLNQNYVPTTDIAYWDNTNPTDSVFTVGDNSTVNNSGGSFVAYLFAHDPDGEDDDGMIACGSMTNSSGSGMNTRAEIGWEPQFVIFKSTNVSGNWHIMDTMRGAGAEGTAIDARLYPNLSNAEASGSQVFTPDATGFSTWTNNGDSKIYMAIRAPMMVEPESGTEVFAIADSMSGSTQPAFNSPFPVDMGFQKRPAYSQTISIGARLTGTKHLYTDTTAAEVNESEYVWDFNDGWGGWTVTNSDYMSWMFKRAKGFFDVVAYTGGTAPFEVNHSLGVPPEMIWIKNRITVDTWAVYHGDATKYLVLNSNAASANSLTYLGGSMWSYPAVEPTSTAFTLGGSGLVNNNSTTPYIAYLFASLEGVSKVGNYTGNGTSQTIDCGFAGGARFVLIKRTDNSGNWKIMDTSRGIETGDDKVLELDNTSSESTFDLIDPAPSGFIVKGNTTQGQNQSTATYIFLAIA